MKMPLHVLLATAFSIALLTGCGKQAESPAETTAAAPAVQESAKDATGTTTFYGEDEQTSATNN